MPAFDKKIELVIISHPQKDHYGGLSSVVKYYKINRIIINELDGKKKLPLELKNIIIKLKIYLLLNEKDFLKQHQYHLQIQKEKKL